MLFSRVNFCLFAHRNLLLLLCCTFTPEVDDMVVQGGKANSHAKKGWEQLTDAAIKAVASQRSGIVFILWGNSAQDKIRWLSSLGRSYLVLAAVLCLSVSFLLYVKVVFDMLHHIVFLCFSSSRAIQLCLA